MTEVLARYLRSASNDSLRQALDLLASDHRGIVTPSAIGLLFRTYRDRRCGTLKLIKTRDKKRRAEAQWWVLLKRPRGWEED